ncbi:MAG: FAD-dependent thymidylate synthase, partial [Candidatus Shapirobacteria bacterium]|nr:FAD-dependent thymidylate synthase [Candidatus Shapirobacteria bacterium]
LATKTRLEEKAVKLAQEIARYLLPVNQFSVMDHTLNELQLLRSFRGSAQENVRDETRYLLAKMIEKITEGDKSILEELREPVISARGYGTSQQYISENKAEFDDSLGGRTSKLELFDPRSREVVARAIRNVLGVSKSQMSDHEALMRAMDPAQNGLLADVFETGINDPLTQCLQLFNFQFATVLSHSGHSQGQRHRGVSGAVPPIESMFDGTADYFVPMIVKEDPKLFEWYQKKSEQIFYNVNRCLESGMPKKAALMLIPNSFNIRFFETGNLSPTSLFHKDKLRLCLNAQEEIFFSVLDQVEQTIAVLPEARVMLLAPCGVRTAALIRPRCPEGKRWCGQQIWGEPIEDYRAGRLI